MFLKGAISASTQQRHRIYEYSKYIWGVFESEDCFHDFREKEERRLLKLYHACSRWGVRVYERYYCTREVVIIPVSSSYPAVRGTKNSLSFFIFITRREDQQLKECVARY